MRAGIVLSAVLFFLSPSSSWATDVIVDHVEFVREQGKPQTATTTFSACDPEGTFTLVVDNGQDGAHRVSSGTISVNGIPVVTQDDFNQQVSVITKPLLNIQESNQLEVLLASAPGSVIKVTIRAEMICLAVTIASPASGSTVSQSEIAVFGHARHRTPEIGVKVNGILAQVNGDRWVANDVPLQIGENTLHAVVTDERGRTNQTSVTVVVPGEPSGGVRLVSNVSSGVAPLKVSFDVVAHLDQPATVYRMDFDGDGTTDLETADFSGVVHTYDSEGIFPATLTIVAADGTIHADSLAVNVHPLPPVKTKWEKMKVALSANDAPSALRDFAPYQKERYGAVFAELSGRLPQIVAQMEDIELVYVVDDQAKYRIRRTEAVDGLPTAITYYIYFARDAEGFWRIKSF